MAAHAGRTSSKAFTFRWERGCASACALLKEAAKLRTTPLERDPVRRHASHRPQRRRAGARAFPGLGVQAHRARRPAPGLDLPRHVGRGDSRPAVPDRRRLGRGAVPQARIYDPRLPRLSGLRQGGRGGRIFLSRTGLPGPGRRRRRALPDRPRKLWPQGPRGGRRGDLLALDGGGRGGGRKARGAARRRRPVRRPPDGARPARALAAAPEAGARARPRPCGHPRRPLPERARPARRAGRDGERRPRGRPRAGPGPAWRSPASTPSAAARRARSPTGSSSRRRSARATRSGPRNDRFWNPISPCPAIRTSPPTSCTILAPLGRARPRPGARRLRIAQRLHRRARRGDRGDPLFGRLRARFRLLHRLRVRGARPGPARRAAGARGRALRRPRPQARGDARIFPRSGRRSRSTGCRLRGAGR